MAKEVAGLIKLQIKGGAANHHPVGPALGSKGINIMEFASNSMPEPKTRQVRFYLLSLLTTQISLFDFVIKTLPLLFNCFEVAKVKRVLSLSRNCKKVAELTWEQVRTIAQDKMVDLNCFKWKLP